MIYEIFSQDSFRMKVTVMDNGSPKDLTGAAVSVFALTGRNIISATVNLANLATGEIGFIFPAATFQVGDARVQCRVDLGGETQTVADISLQVAKSIMAA